MTIKTLAYDIVDTEYGYCLARNGKYVKSWKWVPNKNEVWFIPEMTANSLEAFYSLSLRGIGEVIDRQRSYEEMRPSFEMINVNDPLWPDTYYLKCNGKFLKSKMWYRNISDSHSSEMKFYFILKFTGDIKQAIRLTKELINSAIISEWTSPNRRFAK